MQQRSTQANPVSFSIHRKPHVIARREKSRNLDVSQSVSQSVSHCNLVMHYFALATDTIHHGTIFIPIVHSVPLVASSLLSLTRYRNVEVKVLFVFTVKAMLKGLQKWRSF